MSPYLLVFAIPLVAAVAGALRRDAPRPDPLALAGAGIVGIVFAVLAAASHDPEVPSDDAVLGVAAAAVPVVFYYFVGWILVLGLVHCPPDAYECPL